MEEILHHLGMLRPVPSASASCLEDSSETWPRPATQNPIKDGIVIILGGAGFCPSTVAMENGPGLKMYFLLKVVIFHSLWAMLVYWRVIANFLLTSWEALRAKSTTL